MKSILFLDRDGVINQDVHYLHRWEDVHWVDGLIEALQEALRCGYEIIVVTNQSGVARGYFTEKDVQTLHEKMTDALAEQGIPVLAFYYCPHLKGATNPAYDQDCSCRKPKPGMIVQAMQDYAIDKTHSFLVGDSPRDVEAAEAAGIRGYLFEGTNLYDFLHPILQEEINNREE